MSNYSQFPSDWVSNFIDKRYEIVGYHVIGDWHHVLVRGDDFIRICRFRVEWPEGEKAVYPIDYAECELANTGA